MTDRPSNAEQCLCKEDGFVISRTLCKIHGPNTTSELREAVKAIVREAIEIDWEHDPNLIPLPDRATDEILALFQAHQQQLLTDAYEHGYSDGFTARNKSLWKPGQNKTNDGGSDGGL